MDVVDVHLTSDTSRVDAFTKYPLLDGSKKGYTVELTELVCSLGGQTPLPDQTPGFDNLMFEIRRKRVAKQVGATHDQTSLVTSSVLLPSQIKDFLPEGLFTTSMVQFRKDPRRPMQTPGDMVYQLQRYFDDVYQQYRKNKVFAKKVLDAEDAIKTLLEVDEQKDGLVVTADTLPVTIKQAQIDPLLLLEPGAVTVVLAQTLIITNTNAQIIFEQLDVTDLIDGKLVTEYPQLVIDVQLEKTNEQTAFAAQSAAYDIIINDGNSTSQQIQEATDAKVALQNQHAANVLEFDEQIAALQQLIVLHAALNQALATRQPSQDILDDLDTKLNEMVPLAATLALSTQQWNETTAKLNASKALIEGDDPTANTNDGNGLYWNHKKALPEIEGDLHGGVTDVTVKTDERFVEVDMRSSGVVTFMCKEAFCDNFFLIVTPYGAKILGLTEIVAFADVGNTLIVGRDALYQGTQYVNEGDVGETVESKSLYPLYRFFDHRVRLEVETQMGIPPSVVWSTDEKQKMSYVIATFPIGTVMKSIVKCTSEGAPYESVMEEESYLGDIVWRRAEDKVRERYLLQNISFVHNVRVELFIVRREWSTNLNKFFFVREKMVFSDGEFWTAKLRFRTIK